MNRSLLAAAIFLVTSGFAADPTSAGDAALAKFDLDAAIHDYRLALQEQPNNYEATWKLCRGLLDRGTLTKDRDAQKPLFVEGERLARRAVALNPIDSKGHLYLSIAVGKLALFEGGKRQVELSKEVKTEAEQALTLNDKEALAYLVVGIWNREMVDLNWILKKFAEMFYGKFPAASLAEAEKNLQHAIALAPTVVANQVELGLTYRVAGMTAEARRCFVTALKMPQTWVTDDYYKAIARRYD